MIRRVFRGHGVQGLLRYLFGEGRRNEHDNPHLIASWDGDPAGLEPRWDAAAGKREVGRLAKLLAQPVAACDRPPEEFVYHLVFRAAPEDRRLSDEEWAQVCRAAMDRTGIAPEGDPAGCRWVAVRHADDHVHLVATLVREDGRPPRLWRDYRALEVVAHEFEQRYGLRSTAGWGDRTAAARPGVKESVTAELAGWRVPPRVELREKVKAAAGGSRGFAEFTARLEQVGVRVWPRLSDTDPGVMTGYSVSLEGWTNAAGQPVRFGGGKLAPDLSLPQLCARWEAADPPRAGEVRLEGPDVEEPLTDDAVRVWQEAERIVRDAADRIRADAASDPDGAADAAWAAGDTLAAAAAGLEGDRGGPLTDAAALFDRAGRVPFRRIPERTDTGRALRTAGRLVTLLAPTRRTAGTQVAAVTVALSGLVAAVADLRAAQHRAHQAAAALAAARRLDGAAPTSPPPSEQGPQPPPPAKSTTGQRGRSPAARSFPAGPPRLRRGPAGNGQNADRQPPEQLHRGPDRRGPRR